MPRLTDNKTVQKSYQRQSVQIRKKESSDITIFTVMHCSVFFFVNSDLLGRSRLFICTSASVIIRTEYRL